MVISYEDKNQYDSFELVAGKDPRFVVPIPYQCTICSAYVEGGTAHSHTIKKGIKVRDRGVI